MSNSEFDHYLTLIGKLLQLTRQQQESIGMELRDHLESRISDLMEFGVDRNEAIKQALEEFGDAALMAQNLKFVSQIKRRRWMMKLATFSIAGSFLMAILAMAMWPENARFGAPGRTLAEVDKQDPAVTAKESPSPNESTQTDTQLDPTGEATAKTLEKSKSVFELNDEIERKLKEAVDFDYQEVQWRTLREDLVDRFQINIITDHTALDDQLNDEELLSIKLHGLPFEVCLKHLLKQNNATFVVKDGALLVISSDFAEASEFLSIRSFDCRELIQKLDLDRSSKKFENLVPDRQLGVMGGGGLGGGGLFRVRQDGVGGGPAPPSIGTESGGQSSDKQRPVIQTQPQIMHNFRVADTREELLTNLVMLMTSSVDKWENVGSVKVVNGFLIVRHTRETLEEVKVFLTMLESSIQDF